MKKWFLGALLLVGAVNLRADLPKDPVEYSAWEGKMLEAIRSQAAAPTDEAIPKLGKWVRQLSLPYNLEKGDRPVFFAAQNALLATPGHAEFYAKDIKEQQRRLEHLDVEGHDDLGAAQSRLLNAQMYGFQTLEVLPSPETVRVLGEFLFDTWGLRPDPKPGQPVSLDEIGRSDNASRALLALARLPLETRANAAPPVHTQYANDIDAWKLWYQQVRAGTRTFRFKGDPQNYTLDGPVAAAVEPAPLRAHRGDASAEAKDAATKDDERGVPGLAVTLAGALLIGAAWYLLRSRRSRGSTAG